jgi:CubicO group peptidase (beta-lactamase class C family)
VEAEVQRRSVPGAAIGLLYDGQEHIATFGVTSVDNSLPVNEDTLFQVGSITKTFTATATMRLIDDGVLDLDRPVKSYLPELRLRDPRAGATVTPRHLLTHTAGWVGDYFSDTGRGDDALARYIAELADLEQLTPPGELYSYSNSGFSLLGRLIEVVTGETFEAALKRLVLRPLGLESSFLFPEDVMTRRYSVGHGGMQEGQPRVLQPWALPRSATPAGGLIASVRDQLRYAQFHLGDGAGLDGQRLLARTSLEKMREPLVTSTGLPERAVGLAWNIGSKNISHGGGTYGQSTFLLVCPGSGVALSVLTNASNGGEVAAQATGWVLERLVGVQQPQTPAIEIGGDVLDSCVGLYQHPNRDIEIGRLGDALVARQIDKGGFPTKESPPRSENAPLIRFGFYALDRLVGLDPPFADVRAELIRDPAGGQVEWLRFGGRLCRRRR